MTETNFAPTVNAAVQEEDMQILAAYFPHAASIKRMGPDHYKVCLTPSNDDRNMLLNFNIQIIHSTANCMRIWKNVHDAELPLIISVDKAPSAIMKDDSMFDLILYRYPPTYPFAFLIERDKLHRIMNEYCTAIKLRYKKKWLYFNGAKIDYYSVPVSKVMNALKSIYVVNPVKVLDTKWGVINNGHRA